MIAWVVEKQPKVPAFRAAGIMGAPDDITTKTEGDHASQEFLSLSSRLQPIICYSLQESNRRLLIQKFKTNQSPAVQASNEEKVQVEFVMDAVQHEQRCPT